MRTYVLLTFGTFGARVAKLVARQLALFGREPLATAAFDSNLHDSLAPFVLPVADGAVIHVSVDGQELRAALERGEYPRLRGLDRELLKVTKTDGGFSLYPGMGLAAATVKQRVVRDVLRRRLQSASGIAKASGGEIVVVRAFSSFGGTSRGLVWESSEALAEIAAGAGLRVHVLDLVAVPGLGTATTEFNQHYRRNTSAFVKEIAALRAEAFHRHVWSDRGEPQGTRSSALPSTLVLLNDTTDGGHTLTLDDQAATVARFIELLTRPEVSGAFWESYVDLVRHGTTEPFAARLGLYSLFVPAREQTLAQHYYAMSGCLERLLEPGDRLERDAGDFLLTLGLRAPDTSRLPLLDAIRKGVVDRIGHDPAAILGGLFVERPVDYFDEYQQLVADLRGVEPQEVAREVADTVEKSGTIADELAQLRNAMLPGPLRAMLARALALLEEDRVSLGEAVEDVGQEQVEEEERAAGSAQEAHHALRRRWWRRLLRVRRGAVQDALEEVKAHLQAALARRVDFLCLRIFVLILDRLVADLRTHALPAWPAALEHLDALIAALEAVKAEVDDLHHRATSGSRSYRGPAAEKTPPLQDRGPDAVDADVYLERLRPILVMLYGAERDAVRREVMDRCLPLVKAALRTPSATLAPEALSEADLRDAADKAAPLAPVDGTRASGLRARFVIARGADASPLKPVAQRAWAGSAQVDRERWIDTGAEFADEFVVMTFEDGMRLGAYKALLEARPANGAGTEADRSHLEPFFALLPDPLDPGPLVDDERRRVILLGLAAGLVHRVTGGFKYISEHGIETPLDPLSYETAAAITSRFIVRLRGRGRHKALRELRELAHGRAWQPLGPEVLAEVERLCSRYQAPVSDGRSGRGARARLEPEDHE